MEKSSQVVEESDWLVIHGCIEEGEILLNSWLNQWWKELKHWSKLTEKKVVLLI